MSGPVTKQLHLLIVEDNPGDVRLIQEALEETGKHFQIAVAKDGVEALDYLFGCGTLANAELPDLITLDLNLPKKGGCEVLAEIKKATRLMNIPVVVFSSSAAPADVAGAYELHANCYVTKPADLDEFFHKIGWIEKFWLETARLPQPSAA